MKTFNVYKHPIQGHEAVKIGFSWPAFFFTFIWMLTKRLWGYAGLWSLAAFLCLLVETIATNPRSGEVQPVIAFILFILYLTLALVPAFKGNRWREENLAKRGYELLGTAQAETPDAAVAQHSSAHKAVVPAVTPPSERIASPVGATPPAPLSPTVTTSTENLAPASLVVDEDAIYAAIGRELETGSADKGLWTRLFAECDGDENRTKVAYIKQRAEKLKAIEQARLTEIARQREEESARAAAVERAKRAAESEQERAKLVEAGYVAHATLEECLAFLADAGFEISPTPGGHLIKSIRDVGLSYVANNLLHIRMFVEENIIFSHASQGKCITELKKLGCAVVLKSNGLTTVTLPSGTKRTIEKVDEFRELLRKLLTKGMCPNCNAVIPLNPKKKVCPKCSAMLGDGSAWQIKRL